jgi:hypothetical protein
MVRLLYCCGRRRWPSERFCIITAVLEDDTSVAAVSRTALGRGFESKCLIV